MRVFAASVVFVAAVVLALMLGGASALNPSPARIQLTAKQVSVRFTPAGVARSYALFNRPAFPNRLGTAVVRCDTVARGWLDCTEILRLSRGEIITRGLIPSAAVFRVMAVTGGTGYYSNVGGEMTTQPLGAGQLVIVNLEGF